MGHKANTIGASGAARSEQRGLLPWYKALQVDSFCTLAAVTRQLEHAYSGMAGSEADVLVIGKGVDHQAVQLPPLLQQWAQLVQILPTVFQQTFLLLFAQMQCLLQQSHSQWPELA